MFDLNKKVKDLSLGIGLESQLLGRTEIEGLQVQGQPRELSEDPVTKIKGKKKGRGVAHW